MKIFSLKTLGIVRLIFAALFTLAFTLLFSGLLLKSNYFIMTRWQFLPRVLTAVALSGLITISALMFVAVITSLFGRLYCSWLCPLGLLQDLIERFNHKFLMRKPRKYRPANPVLRTAIFAGVLILMFSGFSIFMGFVEPYSLFGKISSGVLRKLYVWGNESTAEIPQTALYNSHALAIYLGVSGGILLGIIILTIFKGRIFCNMICPTGSLLAGLSARSARRLEIDKNLCVKCGKCEKVCNGNCIDIPNQKIDFLNCFMCLECAAHCPKDAINLVRRRKNDLTDADVPQDKERRDVLLAAGIAGAGAFVAGKLLDQTTKMKSDVIAPPGAGSVERFLATCTGCGLCISNCRGGCLQPASSEYGWKGFMLPTMKFSGKNPGKCEFECTNCTKLCPTGALQPLRLNVKKRTCIGMAHFYPDRCLSVLDGQDCGACGEHCPTGALEMLPGANGATVPHVIPDICIGCGNCEFACPAVPVKAIRVKGIGVHKLAKDPEAFHKEQAQKSPVEAPSEIPF